MQTKNSDEKKSYYKIREILWGFFFQLIRVILYLGIPNDTYFKFRDLYFATNNK